MRVYHANGHNMRVLCQRLDDRISRRPSRPRLRRRQTPDKNGRPRQPLYSNSTTPRRERYIIRSTIRKVFYVDVNRIEFGVFTRVVRTTTVQQTVRIGAYCCRQTAIVSKRSTAARKQPRRPASADRTARRLLANQ